MSVFPAIGAVFMICVSAVAQSVPPEQLPLERHLTLAPVSGNPRNSEGDFVRLNDGRWLFLYTHFLAGASDHAGANLASRESLDGGRTWSKTDKVEVANEGGFNVMSVSLLRLRSGPIALFYLRKNSLEDCRPVMRLSTDEARTWSAPVECIPDASGYFVLNNSRVIQLASGRLVLPTALHDFRDGRLLAGKVVVFLSDDEGKTWRRSSSVLEKDNTGTVVNLMEPGVVETEPQTLRMLIRTKLGVLYGSESSDGGETWSVPMPTALMSPESPATITRIPESNHLLLIWNDHAGKPEEYRRATPPHRTPLSAAISRDGGKTWSAGKRLEDREDHGYCYTAVAFSSGRALLAYCAHPSRYGLETLQISSFALDDLLR